MIIRSDSNCNWERSLSSLAHGLQRAQGAPESYSGKPFSVLLCPWCWEGMESGVHGASKKLNCKRWVDVGEGFFSSLLFRSPIYSAAGLEEALLTAWFSSSPTFYLQTLNTSGQSGPSALYVMQPVWFMICSSTRKCDSGKPFPAAHVLHVNMYLLIFFCITEILFTWGHRKRKL